MREGKEKRVNSKRIRGKEKTIEGKRNLKYDIKKHEESKDDSRREILHAYIYVFLSG